jgi:serine/threonine protein phosphatase PrpC
LRSALLLGRDHHTLGAMAAVAEGPAALTISRGGARKTYDHVEPNEDAALFALGDGGWLVAVADGHSGASGSEAVVECLHSVWAPRWTAAEPPFDEPGAWAEMALDAVLDCVHAVLSRAAERQLPPAPTTLALALVRPAEGWLAHACVGDSHVFRVDGSRASDLGWPAGVKKRSYFIGHQAGDRQREQEMSRIGCNPLSGAKAVVLATDGLSEIGIGVADPAAAALEAVSEAETSLSDLRPLAACKGIGQLAMRAQRENKAGDNIACAVLWLSDSSC